MKPDRGRVVAVSGVKHSGKTTLIEGMLPHLRAAGLRVAVVKHDGHGFAPEPPAVDTGRAWAAGAYGAAVFDGEKFLAVKRERVEEEALIALFPEADLILLEGFKHSPWPKLEVVRSGVSVAPVCQRETLLALVTDLPLEVPGVPRLALSDAAGAAALVLRRVWGDPPPVSGIVLAGGRSRRMGRDKAALRLPAGSFLERQVETLRAAGAGEVLVSGPFPAPGARSVPDVYPDRGPLGGLHACLRAAANPRCLVVPVDMPLLPAAALSALLRAHMEARPDATVLTNGGEREPLVAVYEKRLADVMEPMLARGRNSVKGLLDRIQVAELPYKGREALLLHCNTPEEYEKLNG